MDYIIHRNSNKDLQSTIQYYTVNYEKPILRALSPVAIWVEDYTETEGDFDFYKKLGSMANEINSVFLSRFGFYYKGLDVLVKGVNHAVKQMKKVNFSVFLIDPDYRGGKLLTEQTIEKGNLQSVIHIIDYKSCFPSKAPLISADAQITLSPCDGVLRTVRECLYFGVHQVVSEGTQMADLISKYDAGFVIKYQENKHDYEMLGDYLVWLSANPQVLKRQADNTRQAVSELNDQSVSENFKKFYSDVCLRESNNDKSVNATN